MLRVQVGLGAVRARELAIGILLRDDGALGGAGSCGGSGPSGRAGQYAAASLRADHVSRLLRVLEDGLLVRHKGALAVWRREPGLRHDSTSGHRAQDWRAGGRRRRNGLRVGRGHRGLGHHGARGSIALMRLWVRVRHHLLVRASRVILRRGRVAAHVVGRGGRVGCSWSARRVGVAAVDRLHRRVLGLQRRERVRREVAVLELVRRDCCWRRIARCRCAYHIRGIVRAVHYPERRGDGGWRVVEKPKLGGGCLPSGLLFSCQEKADSEECSRVKGLRESCTGLAQ